MTVAELIEKLKTFDQTLPVLVTGFDEWGCDPLASLDIVEVVPVKPASHGPAYEDARYVKAGEAVGDSFAALWFGR